MLLPLLFAADPGREPLTPREPEITPGEPPTEPSPETPSAPPGSPEVVPPSEPPTEPSPDPAEVPPPGVPEEPPELDIPDGPGVADPDLAPGAPLSPPPYRAADPAEDRDTPSDWFAPYDTASLPPDHPAYGRVQTRSDGPHRGQVLSLFAGLVLVLVGLLVTYLLLRPGAGEATALDLLTVAAARADAVTLDVTTSDLDVAEEYIIGEFGWPVRVPVLPEARLVGAGVDVLAEGVEVPVLRYARDDGSALTVYVYDYAFLDAASERLTLAPPVYARLAEDPPVDVRRVGEAYLILWRRRAAIYTAVTHDDPAPLVEYLRRR